MIDVCFGIWEGFISLPFPVVEKNSWNRLPSATCHVGPLLFAGAPLKKMEDLPSYPPIQYGLVLFFWYHPKTHAQVFSTDVNHPEKSLILCNEVSTT